MNNLSPGTYTFTVVATDNFGATSVSAPVGFVVKPPANQMPVVLITSPSNGTSYIETATVAINATASDADGNISLVEFYNGATLLGSDAVSPYSFTWTPVTAGSYSITAKAIDNHGGTGSSAAVNISVTANQPSVITITSPLNNATISESPITINVNVSDPEGGIILVEFLDGTSVIGTGSTAPYSYIWNNPSGGTHQVSLRVTDSHGGVTTSSPVIVVVDTQSALFNPPAYETSSNVYPNPTLELFTMKASQEIRNLWVINMYGVEVSAMHDIPTGEQVVIGKELSDGAYVLMIKYASDKMEVKRIVKIK
jgi:hypothetical protein